MTEKQTIDVIEDFELKPIDIENDFEHVIEKEEAPREVKSAALRMKMAVQKGDYDKAIAAFELLKNNM